MHIIKTFLFFQLFIILSADYSFSKENISESLMDSSSGIHFSINNHKKGRPNLLFVHGTPGSLLAYKNYLKDPDLDKRYNMISFDRLGFGSSFSKTPVTTFKEHSESIFKFLDINFPNKKFSCVGHSYGGPLCLDLMSRRPNTFNDAVLIAGAFNHERKILRWYNRVGRNTFINKILPISFRNSNAEMFALKNELLSLSQRLSKIQSKVHLLHGKADKIVPYKDSEWLYDKLSQSQKGKLEILNKNGHLMLWKNLEKMKSFILENIN